MKKTKKALASLAIMGMVATMAPINALAATGVTTDRLYGADRFQTAVKVADKFVSADTAILAPAADANLVDALAAAPLAGKNAPILLTENNTLNDATKAELIKLGVTKVYVVGAIDQAVVDQVNAMTGVTATVLKGDDRIATAAMISSKLTNPAGSFVVGYDALADALSVASYAAANNYSILVTNPDGSFPDSEAAYKGAKVYTVGGPTLVDDIAGATRLAGADRFATNKVVLDTLGYSYNKVYVANGTDAHLVDSLVASSLAAASSAPIVLTDTATGGNAAAASVGAKLATNAVVVALGGSTVVSDTTVAKVTSAVPAVLEVSSVSAINAKQIEVKFNKAVLEDSVVNSDNLVSGTVTLARTTNSDDGNKNADLTSATAALSDDGITLTITLDPTADSYLDGIYSVVVTDKVTTDEGQKLAPYSTIISSEDTTAPVVTGVKYLAATNEVEVSFSEPLKVVPGIVRQNSSPVAVNGFSKSDKKIKFTNAVETGTSADVYVALGEDFAGNVMSSYTNNLSIPKDTAALNVNSLTQSGSNQVTVIYNKAIAGADAATAEAAVVAALVVVDDTTVYLDGVGNTVFTATRDADDSTKFKVTVVLDSTAPVNNYGIYASGTTKELTFKFAKDSLTDVFDNKIGSFTNTITLTKDVAGPTLVSAKLAADGQSFELEFSEKLGTVTEAKIFVRESGVDTTAVQSTTKFNSDKSLRIIPDAAYVDGNNKVKSGSYTIRLDKGAAKDIHNNDNASFTTSSVSVSESTKKLTATISNKAGVVNTFKVEFDNKASDSALNLNNYRLDGAVLPSTADIYFADAGKQIVYIAMPSSSINVGEVGTGTTAMLTVLNVKDVDNVTVTTKSSAVTVEDNTTAVLQTASLTGNTLVLTFNENVDVASFDWTNFKSSFIINKDTAKVYTPGTDTAVISVDGKKVYITVTAGNGNWASAKSAATMTLVTADTTAVKDANLLAVKTAVQVNVSK